MVVHVRLVWFSLLVLALFPRQLRAQTEARVMINQKINNQQRVILHGSQHPLARPEFEVAEIDPALKLDRMLLLLTPPPERQADLATFMESQYDRNSPNFHHWLTPEEFGQKFGPAQQDIQSVTGWLEQQGFTVSSVAKSGRWIEFAGSSGQVERSFQTLMARYQVGDKTHVANAQEISIPEALTPVVGGIVSLHNFLKKPLLARGGQLRRDAGGTFTQVDPNFTSSTGLHALAPADFASIYDIPAAAIGTGQTIAIVARGNVSLSDINDFRQQFGVPFLNTSVTVNGPDPGFDPNSGDSVEATLDTQWAGAVAPGAALNVVVSSPTLTTDGVDLSAAYIVDNNVAGIMSASFGECERDLGPAENAFIKGLWQQAAAEGISVFVSSGDNGAAACDNPGGNLPGTVAAVSGLASTPFNTAVGGTQFSEGATPATFWSATNGPGRESAIGYVPETVWNESCGLGTTPCPPTAGITASLFASSGGSSLLYSKLDAPWQNLNGTQAGDGQRDLPDVSLTAAGAHDPYLICLGGSCSAAQPSFFGIGGTSASSPAFAGIMALVNQSVGGRQGLANYLLYKLAGSQTFSACNSSARTNPAVPASANCIFNDVTAGNNSVPGVSGVNAVQGYDEATGLGSVDVTHLINAWTNSVPALAATSTTLTPSSITGTHGAGVAVNVQVSGSAAAPPTGAVSLTTSRIGPGGNNAPAESVLLSGAAFSGSIFDLPGGTYTLTAHYPGDANNRASDSAAVAVTISPEASTTTEQVFGVNAAGTAFAPTTTLAYGDFMNLNATIAGASRRGFASGTVTFKDGAATIGSAPLNQVGQSDLFFFFRAGDLDPLTVGSHSVSAVYSGDSSFNQSSSPALNLTVTRATPAIVVTPQGGSAFAGDPIVLGVIVVRTGPILPTGTVQFFEGSTPLGTPTTFPAGNDSTEVQFTLPTDDGQHTIAAHYSGDSVYNSAVSTPVIETLVAPFSIIPAAPSASVAAGGTATFNLTVSNNSPLNFAGTVALSCVPAGNTTCTVSPATINLNNTVTEAPAILTVTTALSARLKRPFGRIDLVFATLFAGLLMAARPRPKQAAVAILALFFIVGMSSCGGGNGSSSIRQPSNDFISVIATSGNQTSEVSLSLVITH